MAAWLAVLYSTHIQQAAQIAKSFPLSKPRIAKFCAERFEWALVAVS